MPQEPSYFGVVISVQNLCKYYSEKVKAVDNLSFSAKAGEIYGLLGPNGAGKTTTLRMLATLLKPTSGSISVAGFDTKRQPEDVRRSIGVVNGGMGLYDRLTGQEILEYFAAFYNIGKQDTQKRIKELSDALEMNELLKRRAGEYSTGMKQKIVIARAVIHNPSVLILDEATNGLDVVARRAVLDFARAYKNSSRVVLYSTHVMSEAEELCERTAIIDHGKLVAEDSLPNLKAKAGSDNLEETFFRLTRGVK
ncbi:MAG: ABC transporter ATP-binding protein [Deinococcales bacterium]